MPDRTGRWRLGDLGAWCWDWSVTDLEKTHNTAPWGIGTWPLAIPHLGCGLSERKIVDRGASKETSVTVGVILKRKPRLDLLKDFCTSWLEPLVQLVIVNDVKLLHLIPCFVSSSWNNTKSVDQDCTVHYMQIVFEYLSSQAAWSLVWEYVFVERTMWGEGSGGGRVLWVQGRSQVHVPTWPSCCPRGILKFQSLPLTLRFTLTLSHSYIICLTLEMLTHACLIIPDISMSILRWFMAAFSLCRHHHISHLHHLHVPHLPSVDYLIER